MRKKFWQTKRFKELQREWDLKLAEAGFKDAETSTKGNRVLRQKASNCYRQACQVIREAKQRYYDMLGEGYHKETAWVDEVEGFVMEQRAHGVKIKRICEELKDMGERCHRETVRGIIRKYEVKWKIRK